MNTNKTQITDRDPAEFVASVHPDQRRVDAETLLEFFHNVTGYSPKMWGPSMIGYGRYHYIYESGREGDFLATGFSPRRANLSIYIMPGYADYSPILQRLGKHKTGRSCLYINKLADVDMGVLAKLVRAGLADLDRIWKVHPA